MHPIDARCVISLNAPLSFSGSPMIYYQYLTSVVLLLRLPTYSSNYSVFLDESASPFLLAATHVHQA